MAASGIHAHLADGRLEQRTLRARLRAGGAAPTTSLFRSFARLAAGRCHRFTLRNRRVPHPGRVGREAGLQTFRGKLHDHGLRLVLDFVPNHLGLDHPWVRQRPQLSFKAPARRRRFSARTRRPVPAAGSWEGPELRRLERYRPTGLSPPGHAGRHDGIARKHRRSRRRGALRHGDAAAQRRVCQHLETLSLFRPSTRGGILAGSHCCRQECPGRFPFSRRGLLGHGAAPPGAGFDYTYDKTLYDALMAHDGAGVQRHLFELPPEGLARGAHFLENHDEPRIASRLSPAEQRAAALLVLGLPGLRFLHEGQCFAGARVKRPCNWRAAARSQCRPISSAFTSNCSQRCQPAQWGREGHPASAARCRGGKPTAQTIIAIEWQAEPPNFDLVVVDLAPRRFLHPADDGETPWSQLVHARPVGPGKSVVRRRITPGGSASICLPTPPSCSILEPARCRELGLARICFSLF